MRRRLVPVLLCAFGLVAAPAHAATRYAAPVPTGDCTSELEPCSLREAMFLSKPGDVVVAGAGTYAADGEALPTVDSFTVRGAVIGDGRPKVTLADTLQVAGTGVLQDLPLQTKPAVTGPAVSALGRAGGDVATLERIVVRGSQDACDVGELAQLRNALCTTQAPGAAAVRVAKGAVVRDVTAISDRSDAVVLQGPGAKVLGVVAAGGIAGPTQGSTLTCNRTTAAAIAVERPAAGSPAIDACDPADLKPYLADGELDLAGNLRLIGTKVDQGAYELVTTKPAVTGAAATAVDATTANLNAVVDPKQGLTTFRFEWGTSTGYGSTSTTGFRTGAGPGTPPTVRIIGLRPATTYHYRLVATNDAGMTPGPDTTFTTAAATEPVSAGGDGSGTQDGGVLGDSSSGGTTSPGVILALAGEPISVSSAADAKRLKPTLRLDDAGPMTARRLLAGRTIKLRVRCGGPSCAVTAGGQLRTKAGRKLGALTVPAKPLRVGRTALGTIGVKASKALRTLVARRVKAGTKVTLRLQATFRDDDGSVVTRTIAIAVPAAKR